MAVLFASGFALALTLYCVSQVCRREFRIRLRWPAVLVLGVVIGGALVGGIKPAVLADIGILRAVYAYPGLSFVLLVLIAALLGRLLRPWVNCFYQKQ